MIIINIKCKDTQTMVFQREEMHNGLVGSPAYINSEIAICDADSTSFNLVIGNISEDNVEYVIDQENIIKK